MTLNFRSKITYVAWCLRATEKLYLLQYWSLYWASSIAGFSISSSRSDTHFLTLSTLPYGRAAAAAAAYLHHILRESPYNNISLILSLSVTLSKHENSFSFFSLDMLQHSLFRCFNILLSLSWNEIMPVWNHANMPVWNHASMPYQAKRTKILWNLFCINGGPRLALLFISHSYRHLEGYFLAEMAGKLNWLGVPP